MSKKKRAKLVKRQTSATPQRVVFAIIVSFTFMVCIAINLRAFSELSVEMNQHETLSTEIEQLTIENQLLQKEVKDLKTDTRIIEREARKIGMSRPNEKIFVPED